MSTSDEWQELLALTRHWTAAGKEFFAGLVMIPTCFIAWLIAAIITRFR
jgi:hypothetical protein